MTAGLDHEHWLAASALVGGLVLSCALLGLYPNNVFRWPAPRRFRRPGVVIGRHHLFFRDVVQSVVYSIKGAKRHEILMFLVFACIVAFRRHFIPKKEVWARHFLKRRSSWTALGCLLYFFWWRTKIERPVVSCRRTFWNVAIVEKAGFAKREFRPVFWLTSRHAQTVIAHVLADLAFLVLRPVQWRRESVKTFDDGEVFLDWVVSPGANFEPYGDGLTIVDNERQDARIFDDETASSAPIVLLLYGIGGTKNDHYMKHMALACRARGWRPVVLSYWRLDWNEWRDLDAAVRKITSAYPLAPLFVIAHSASAYILVQYLAASGQNSPVVAAVCLAGCMDFRRAYDFVKHTKNRTYRRVFERGMRRCIRRHAHHDPRIPQDERHIRIARLTRIKDADVMYDRHVASLPQATNLPPLDEQQQHRELSGLPPFTPPRKQSRQQRDGSASNNCAKGAAKTKANNATPTRKKEVVGLLDRTQPHYRTPSRLKLGQVKLPLLIVHAKDDPLVSHDDNYDWATAVQNARIITVRTNRGGHCGWHEGMWPLGPSWAVSIATDYVSAVLEQTAQTGWLCAVFDDLYHRGQDYYKTHLPDASRIAHSAASHDQHMPPPPAEPTFQRMHSLLFDEDVRSSRANSFAAAGDDANVTICEQHDTEQLDSSLPTPPPPPLLLPSLDDTSSSSSSSDDEREELENCSSTEEEEEGGRESGRIFI